LNNNTVKKHLQKNICQKYCSYFRPFKQEELACLGFLVIETLMKKGLPLTFEKADSEQVAAAQQRLVLDFCFACPFFREDCDFVRKTEGAEPCGGFIFLSHLLAKNIIHIDDIRNIL
jgi:hypothetical protein